jgi:hypothetical protein
MALMSPCKVSTYDADIWNWSYAALTNPIVGSTVCLLNWPGHCLAPEADHEHSRVTVTRNAEKWYYNNTDQTFRLVQPKYPFANWMAIQINCVDKDGDINCNRDGAGILISHPSLPATIGYGLRPEPIDFDTNHGNIKSAISESTSQAMCLGMSCFSRGIGLASEGANCGIFQNVSDAQACQLYCRQLDCCEYWTWHADTRECSNKFYRGTEYKNQNLISGPKYCEPEAEDASKVCLGHKSWTRAFGSCWLVDQTNRTWAEAKQYCTSQSGRLGLVTNVDENKFLAGYQVS